MPGAMSIAGRRALVVGASSGIGRAITRELSARGARVVAAGRRAHLLESLVAECAGDAHAIAADVARPDECERRVAGATAWLEGLNVLIYCPGVVKLTEMYDATAEDWTESFGTNLLGAAMCTRAALPHLDAAGGHAVYLSSSATEKVPSWIGLGVYVATKLALESAVRSWQEENPGVAFTIFKVGPTAGEHRELAAGADRIGAVWMERGYITGRQLQAEDHARLLTALLESPGRVESISVVPR